MLVLLAITVVLLLLLIFQYRPTITAVHSSTVANWTNTHSEDDRTVIASDKAGTAVSKYRPQELSEQADVMIETCSGPCDLYSYLDAAQQAAIDDGSCKSCSNHRT